jgi:hypothetical protein
MDYLKALPRNLPGENEENHEKSQPGKLAIQQVLSKYKSRILPIYQIAQWHYSGKTRINTKKPG